MFNITLAMVIFSNQISREAHWEHLFSMYFDDLSIIYLSF